MLCGGSPSLAAAADAAAAARSGSDRRSAVAVCRATSLPVAAAVPPLDMGNKGQVFQAIV